MIDKNSKIYTFYKLTFPNNMVYVGMTRQKVEDRWSKGRGYSGQSFYSDILKYDWDNIKKETTSDLTRDEARQMERAAIKYYTEQERCYNISKGGECGGDKVCEFEYNGKIYNSEELAKLSKYDLTGHDITTRINDHGLTIEEALNRPKIDKNQTVEYKGRQMTFKELSDISPAHIPASVICTRINHRKWDIDRAITQPTDVKKQPFGVTGYKYDYHGKKYSMYELWQMRKIKELSQAVIQNRINHHGWDIDRALSTPLKEYNVKYVYNGSEYTVKELIKFAKSDKLTIQTLRSRLNNGWDVQKALDTPSSKK